MKEPQGGEVWHILTGEYPPKLGGVADYSYLVAAGLAGEGARVHVWCPGTNPEPVVAAGVEVHPELGRLRPSDLRRAGALLDAYPAPRRLLVQWVPHAFGLKSLNLPFCAWLWWRASRRGDRVEIMAHEVFLPFSRRSVRQSAAAAIHRLMTAVLLRAATRVSVSTPEWAARWRPYALGKEFDWSWLPVPSNVPVVRDDAAVSAVRARYAAEGGCVVGHFGTYAPDIVALLEPAVLSVLQADPGRVALLLGAGGEAAARRLAAEHPAIAHRVHAPGALPARELSLHLSACDLMLQPYPAGVNCRRGSVMAALAHGRPIVTTSGWLTEPLWSETAAVELVPDGEPAAFAARAERMLAEPEARQRLGASADSLYRARFDLAHTLAGLRASGGGAG